MDLDKLIFKFKEKHKGLRTGQIILKEVEELYICSG